MSRTITITLAAAALALAGCGTTGSSTSSTTTSAASSTSSPTSATSPAPTDTAAPEAGTLAGAAWAALMGPDGEYAAAASYQAVIEAFGQVEPYVTIESMEQRHIDALTRQLSRWGYTPPANPYIGQLAAPADLTSAAQAWADGEVKNVAMYDALLTEVTDDASLTRVFTNLRRSSQEAHLPMFRAAAANGGTLTEAEMTDLGFMPGH